MCVNRVNVVGLTGEFGCLKWSNGEGHILYAAERNVKCAQYFDADLEWTNEEKLLETNVVCVCVEMMALMRMCRSSL